MDTPRKTLTPTLTSTSRARATYRLTLLYVLGFLLLFSAGELKAQNAVQQTPDCVRFFSFSATGATTNLANYGTGSADGPQACTTWILVYATFGTVTGVSLRVESAPAATINTPGTFVAYAGTVTSGVNPNTSTVGAQTFLANNLVPIPWIRVSLNTFTGSGTRGVFGMLEGWNQGNGGGGASTTCAGTVAAPCIVAGPDNPGAPPTQAPVQVGVFDGTNIQRSFVCPNQAAFTLSAGTDVRIVTGTSAKKTHICHLDFAMDASAVTTIREGTGTTCLTGTATLAGPYQNIVTLAADYAPTSPLVTATNADDVCLHFGASVTTGGVVIYATF